MLKRVLKIVAAVGLLVLMTLPTASVSGARTYSEGIDLDCYLGIPHGSGATHFHLTATKQVEGRWSQTTVVVSYASVAGLRTYTGVLSGDPDGLDVSRDLGWGGLEGEARLVNSKTGEQRVYEFRLGLTADEAGYTEDPATWYFKRHAMVQGQILINGQPHASFPITGQWARIVYGYNFSDQWPGY